MSEVGTELFEPQTRAMGFPRRMVREKEVCVDQPATNK